MRLHAADGSNMRAGKGSGKERGEGGLEAVLNDKPHPGGLPKRDGRQQAFVMALACSHHRPG